MPIKAIFENNDMLIEVDGLRHSVTNEYINDAIVTVTLFKDSVEVTGETWPLSMAYVAGTRAVYRAIIIGSIDLVDGERVDIVVSALGDGLTAEFNCNVKVKKRCE